MVPNKEIIMSNQVLSSRLFERGIWEITRHDLAEGKIVTKPNTTRKFAVELGSRKFGLGTGLIIKHVEEESNVGAR